MTDVVAWPLFSQVLLALSGSILVFYGLILIWRWFSQRRGRLRVVEVPISEERLDEERFRMAVREELREAVVCSRSRQAEEDARRTAQDTDIQRHVDQARRHIAALNEELPRPWRINVDEIRTQQGVHVSLTVLSHRDGSRHGLPASYCDKSGWWLGCREYDIKARPDVIAAVAEWLVSQSPGTAGKEPHHD